MKLPVCPHCGFRFTDDHIWHDHGRCEFPTEHDGDMSEFDCPGCWRRLYVTLETTPSWSFQDEDGEDIS